VRKLFSVALGLALLAGAQGALPAGAAEANRAVTGRFLATFEEPGEKCVKADGTKECKPAAGSMVMLSDGRVLYWNALEGTENVNDSITFEFGRAAVNDQSRLLDLDLDNPQNSKWSKPTPVDGGAKNQGGSYELPEPLVDDPEFNDGSMFCTDLVHLADGRILVVGGTDYYNEPAVIGTKYGLVELEGMKSARIFNPKTNTWEQSGEMTFGRWYPSLVTMGDSKVFVASGVTKLIKPFYSDRPTDSGSNVKQTETYDPATGTWTQNKASADRSLPLYPRLHLLPNGHVFFNAGGQTYNPAGQSYDEALWNMAASYNPETQTWTDLGIPGLGTSAPGFRGSAFSAFLPLRPDAAGNYTKAQFLTAGGVLGTTPGTYLGIRDSLITTVDVSNPARPAMTTKATGPLTAPRWYGSAVTLPDGSVLTLNGANRDEVVAPGTGNPTTTAELFDPVKQTWTPVATAARGRTYHNTAMLLPDGRVLVGGHAPISTLYGKNQTLPGGFSQNDGRDPSFEIYEPPYLFRGDRPVIDGVQKTLQHGQEVTIATRDAADISEVVIARNASVTHVIDNDQRMVQLPIVRQTAGAVTVQIPSNANVAPAGPYLLFINAGEGSKLVPSVAKQVEVRL
jgi:hypothetical protein